FCTNPAASNLPVDLYIGGVEHSILHLLYARFVGKFMRADGIVPELTVVKDVSTEQGGKGKKGKGKGNEPEKSLSDGKGVPNGEPFKKLLTQGMVHGRTFKCPDTGRYLKKSDLVVEDKSLNDGVSGVTIRDTGKQPVVTWEKMSKSKYNGVDPMTIIDAFGTDATRLYVLYKAPPQDDLPWDDQGIVGMQRWISKCWRLVVEATAPAPTSPTNSDGDDGPGAAAKTKPKSKPNPKADKKKLDDLRYQTQLMIREVTAALTDTFAFNVAIASLIKLSNAMGDVPPHLRKIVDEKSSESG
ncbi:Leucyl-tRNA synthetase, mitochondrial, partial [Quaeritorhiza haematococci]